MTFNKDHVLLFWEWFHSISQSLTENLNNVDLLREIDHRVRVLGPFDWEIGPYQDDLTFLAISPRLNPELLEVTFEIVNLAPPSEKWIFLNSKPKKEYAPRFNMINELGHGVVIDISSWSYILYYFEDGTFDMDLKINNLGDESKTKKLATDIALTNILGEEKYMNLVKNVKIVDDFDDATKSTPLFHLDNHLNSILSGR